MIPREAADVTKLMTCLNGYKGIQEYSSLRTAIYSEYFDNRKYLLEQYLDGISFTYNAQVRCHEFLAAFIAKYCDIALQERTYFGKVFPACDQDKFSQFVE